MNLPGVNNTDKKKSFYYKSSYVPATALSCQLILFTSKHATQGRLSCPLFPKIGPIGELRGVHGALAAVLEAKGNRKRHRSELIRMIDELIYASKVNTLKWNQFPNRLTKHFVARCALLPVT